MLNRSSQTGAALIVGLVMLMVLTLIGVSAMNNSIVGEKIAGNTANKQLAFEAAEAALRDGETTAVALPDGTPFSQTANDGHYLPLTTDDAIWLQGDEKDPANSSVSWQTLSGTNLPVVANQPEYIIERMPAVPKDTSCGFVVPPPDGCWLDVHRVTARGWGTNTNGFSMLQSTTKSF